MRKVSVQTVGWVPARFQEPGIHTITSRNRLKSAPLGAELKGVDRFEKDYGSALRACCSCLNPRSLVTNGLRKPEDTDVDMITSLLMNAGSEKDPGHARKWTTVDLSYLRPRCVFRTMHVQAFPLYQPSSSGSRISVILYGCARMKGSASHALHIILLAIPSTDGLFPVRGEGAPVGQLPIRTLASGESHNK